MQVVAGARIAAAVFYGSFSALYRDAQPYRALGMLAAPVTGRNDRTPGANVQHRAIA